MVQKVSLEVRSSGFNGLKMPSEIQKALKNVQNSLKSDFRGPKEPLVVNIGLKNPQKLKK